MHPSALYQCTNTASALAHLISERRTEQFSQLFVDDAQMSLPLEGINLKGVDSIAGFIRDYLGGFSPRIYLLNSPFIFEAEGSIRGSFFLIGYQIEHSLQTMFSSRFDIAFSNNFRIKGLAWYDMLSLVPEQGAELIGIPESPFTVADVIGSRLTVEDMAAIEEMLSFQCHQKASNGKGELQLQFSPVIYGRDDEATASFLTMDIYYRPECDLYVPRLSKETFSMRRNVQDGEAGSWEVADSAIEKIANLAMLKPNPATPPHAAEMIKRKLSIPLPKGGSGTLSVNDIASIRLQGAKWVYGVRSCDPALFIDEVLDTQAPDLSADVIMPIDGMKGFENEFETMRAMREKQPKLQGVHTHTDPYIAQTGPNEAEALWLDLGWTILGEAFGNEEAVVPVLPGFGRYRMKFRKKAGTWKVYAINWGPLILHGSWKFDRATTFGWSTIPGNDSWPGAMETLAHLSI